MRPRDKFRDRGCNSLLCILVLSVRIVFASTFFNSLPSTPWPQVRVILSNWNQRVWTKEKGTKRKWSIYKNCDINLLHSQQQTTFYMWVQELSWYTQRTQFYLQFLNASIMFLWIISSRHRWSIFPLIPMQYKQGSSWVHMEALIIWQYYKR